MTFNIATSVVWGKAFGELLNLAVAVGIGLSCRTGVESDGMSEEEQICNLLVWVGAMNSLQSFFEHVQGLRTVTRLYPRDPVPDQEQLTFIWSRREWSFGKAHYVATRYIPFALIPVTLSSALGHHDVDTCHSLFYAITIINAVGIVISERGRLPPPHASLGILMFIFFRFLSSVRLTTSLTLYRAYRHFRPAPNVLIQNLTHDGVFYCLCMFGAILAGPRHVPRGDAYYLRDANAASLPQAQLFHAPHRPVLRRIRHADGQSFKPVAPLCTNGGGGGLWLADVTMIDDGDEENSITASARPNWVPWHTEFELHLPKPAVIQPHVRSLDWILVIVLGAYRHGRQYMRFYYAGTLTALMCGLDGCNSKQVSRGLLGADRRLFYPSSSSPVRAGDWGERRSESSSGSRRLL
ncbi:hypothetical protein BU15DRAFT_65621 [Melanogaster broomeanus]|nr:hypothetical protein BU15DRAFT_65621 [Melanogaster broomeanus]